MQRRYRNRGGGVGQVTRMPFRSVFTQSRTTTGESFQRTELSLANLGDRASLIGEGFEFFRVTRLHAYAFVDSPVMATGGVSTGGPVRQSLAFINSPASSATAPTTQAQLSQYEHYVSGGGHEKLHLRAGKKDLLAEPMKWYNTFTTGTVPASTLSIGHLIQSLALVAAGTVVQVLQTVVLEGSIEFHSPIATADSLVRIPPAVAGDPTVAARAAKLREAVQAAQTEV